MLARVSVLYVYDILTREDPMPSSHGSTHLSLLLSKELVGGRGGENFSNLNVLYVPEACMYYVLYMRLLISKLFRREGLYGWGLDLIILRRAISITWTIVRGGPS
jgi:hypothetical protein